MIGLSSDREYEYLMSKIKTDLMRRLTGIIDFEEVRDRYKIRIQQLMNILREIHSIRRMYVDKLNYELDILYKEFRKYAIIINVVGIIPLGLGLIVSLPLTYVLYRTWYMPRKTEIMEKLRSSMESIARLEIRYRDALEELVKEVYVSKGLKYEVKKETGERIGFRDIYDLIISHDLDINYIKCPSCGREFEIPLEGYTFKCPKCGYVIRAIDVYNAIKKTYGIVD